MRNVFYILLSFLVGVAITSFALTYSAYNPELNGSVRVALGFLWIGIALLESFIIFGKKK